MRHNGRQVITTAYLLLRPALNTDTFWNHEGWGGTYLVMELLLHSRDTSTLIYLVESKKPEFETKNEKYNPMTLR